MNPNNVLLLWIFFFSASNTFASDIRNADWGMTKAEVKASEKNGIYIGEGEEVLAYSVTLADTPCDLTYHFCPEGPPSIRFLLCEVYYHSASESNLDADEQVLVFYDFCNSLTAKYGKPSEENLVWDNLVPDNLKNDPSNWDEHMALGLLSKEKVWEMNNVVILCKIWGGLKGDMGRVYVRIHYKNLEFSEEQPENDLSDF